MNAQDGERNSSGLARRGGRAWWQWVLGLSILAVAAVSALFRIAPTIWPATVGRAPSRIVVPQTLVAADHIAFPRERVARANVCLITLDTTRADRLGCYGNKDIATPNLDALAASGALFTHAGTPVPITLPAHSTMMTGKYPYHHGSRVNALNRLSDENVTLAELLKDAGYQTAAFVSAHVLDPQYGIAQGFTVYDLDVSAKSEHWAAVAERTADVTADRAIAWLREQAGSGQPFLLWVHFFDAHWSYEPPAPYAERYASNLYDGEIAFVDEQVGRVLGALSEIGAREHAIVVVAGDHGEGLGQHDESTHGTYVYDSTLHVPLIFNCGAGAGVHIDRPVGLIDLLPTVLSLLEFPIPAGLDGIALTAPPGAERALYFETLEGLAEYGWTPFFGVQSGFLKYIHAGKPEMYDLAADYLELNNLLERQPRRGEALAAALTSFYGDDLGQAGSLDADHALSAEDLAKLQSLGYAFGGSSGNVAPEDRLDPHAYMPLLKQVNQAFDLSREDWLAHGTATVEKIVEAHPEFYVARKELGNAYLAQNQLDKAEEQYRACLELRPDLVTVQCNLAMVRAQQGYLEEAIVLYRAVLAQMPGDMLSQARLGGLLVRQKRYEDAVAVLEQAQTLMPLDVDVALNRAVALDGLDRTPEAIEVLQAMLALKPDDARVRNRLSRQLRAGGRRDEAVRVLREGWARQPEHLDFAANLGINLAEWTDLTGARQREAVSILQQVNEQTQRSNPSYLHALGRAYAATGRLQAAIATSGEARTVAANAGQPSLAGVIDRDLTMFVAVQKQLPVDGSTNGVVLPPMGDDDSNPPRDDR